MVNHPLPTLFLYIIVCIVAVSLQLYLSTNLVAKGIVSYKTMKTVRVTLYSVLIGILCALLCWLAGSRIIQWALLLSPCYKLLAMAAILVALRSEFPSVISLWRYVLRLFKTIRWVRILFFLILIGILSYLFYLMTGDRFLYFILLFTPEYIHLTVVAILTLFILYYVQAHQEYEVLNVFGSVLLITWLSVFVIGTSVHLALHFKLYVKAIQLFQYLHLVLPGGYKALPYIILASWIINLMALIYVTGRRISNILIDYIEMKIRSSYQEKIIELIYDDSSDQESSVIEADYFKKVKRLYFTRQLFADELLRMHEIVYGSLLQRINQLFNSLLLTDDVRNYLHSPRWFYKIKGLRIYAELGDKSEITYIQKLIQSKNFVLRFEAELALARLSDDEKPLSYLKDLQGRLSVWEQLNLIYFYTNHQKPVGDLSGLLESANVSVICFGLLCIRKFNKAEYRSHVMELTRHNDRNVRNAAYQTLELYQEAEIGSYIISSYEQEAVASTQIVMIRSLGHTGDATAIPFLREHILSTGSDDITLELFRTLILIDSKQAYEIAHSDYPRFKRLYEHVTETIQ